MWETICDYIIMPLIAGIAAAITYRIGFNNGVKVMEDRIMETDDYSTMRGMINAKYNRED